MSTLRIKLGNRLVGTITNVVTDKNIFMFDPGYVEDEQRPMLSLSYYDIERKLITRPREVQRRLPPFWRSAPGSVRRENFRCCGLSVPTCPAP